MMLEGLDPGPRTRAWGELNTQIVRLLTLIGRRFPESRSPALWYGWRLISDAGGEIAQYAIESPDDPTVAVCACRRFVREIERLRVKCRKIPQSEWLARLLLLGVKMDRALQAMADDELPLEVQQVFGVAGATEALRMEDRSARAAVARWMTENPEPAEALPDSASEPSDEPSRS